MSSRLDDARAALAAARNRPAEPDDDLDLFSSMYALAYTPEPAAMTTAIETAGRHTSPDWRRRALDAVQHAATVHSELTVETVVWPDDVEPYDDRSRGSIMRAAARAGWITSTKSYRPSARPATHRRPLLVVRSEIRKARP